MGNIGDWAAQMNSVWDILTLPDPSVNKKVRWFARGMSGNLGGICYDAQQLLNITKLSEPTRGFNVYVTLNPTTDRICKRIKSEDVTAWAFVLLDLDPLKDVDETEAVELGEDLRGALCGLHPEFEKSAVIYSGRGVQLWVRLPGLPVSAVQEQVPNFYTQSTRGFLEHIQPMIPADWRLDLLSDLARVARLPMTTNQKTYNEAKLIHKGDLATGSLAGFIGTFYKVLPIPQLTRPSAHDKEWEEVKSELTLRAKTFLDLGAVAGNRHESLQHCIKTLWEHGVAKWSAYDAAQYANQSCEPALSEREIAEILTQVYGRE